MAYQRGSLNRTNRRDLKLWGLASSESGFRGRRKSDVLAKKWVWLLLGTAGAALAMLGPGLWSIDARLFGWKRIETPPRKTNSNDEKYFRVRVRDEGLGDRPIVFERRHNQRRSGQQRSSLSRRNCSENSSAVSQVRMIHFFSSQSPPFPTFLAMSLLMRCGRACCRLRASPG